MKALILVGGFGAQLWPLTLSMPKPLVEFANKQLILHQIEALKAAGVTEVILAVNYQPKIMLSFIEEFESRLGIRITCSQEYEPLGTGGPLALAREKLAEEPEKPFFVLNSDITCEYPFDQMLDFHKKHGGEATILVTKVDEPSKYGVVVLDEKTGEVKDFMEKPETFVGNKINAGIYLLNSTVLDQIPLKPTSLEWQVFPSFAAKGQLYAMVSHGFWMDIGQPKRYLKGLRLYLNFLRTKSSPVLASGPNIIGNVLIDETAQIGEGCLIGPDVTIGPGCVIEHRVRLSSCSLLKGVTVRPSAHISGSIIGWHCIIGESAQVCSMAVLGEGVHVKETVFLNGAVVLPHSEINSHLMGPKIIK